MWFDLVFTKGDGTGKYSVGIYIILFKSLKSKIKRDCFLYVSPKMASLMLAKDIDTKKQVSLRSHRSDIATGGGNNSHRSDIVTSGVKKKPQT